MKFDAGLLLVDIDGTLVGRDGTISVPDKAALQKARDGGIKVSLCTGRAVRSCQPVFRELALDGFHIFFDGALVTDPEHRVELYSRRLDPAVLDDAAGFARAQGLHLELYSGDDCFVESPTPFSAMRRDYFSIEPVVCTFDGLLHRAPIMKAGFIAGSPAEVEKARLFQEEFRGRLSFTQAFSPAFPDLVFINIVAPGVSKGEALEFLAGYLGVPLVRVMAIGDGENDIPLLRRAGLSVAMAGSSPEVKAAAGYVTLALADSGVSAALSRFLF